MAETIKRMARRLVAAAGLSILILMAAAGAAQSTRPSTDLSSESPRTQPVALSDVPRTGLPDSAAGGGTTNVFTGKSLILDAPERIVRISVSDPAIATAMVISPYQILIHGLKPGNISLMYWDADGRVHPFDLQVQNDLSPLSKALKQLFPGEDIQASPSGAGIVLSGTVSSPEVATRAEALAKTESASVVNMLRTPNVSDAALRSVRETLQRVFPKENIQVSLSGGALVLYGTASTPDVAKRAEDLAKTGSAAVVNTLNALRVSDVVLLQVRFAEVQRSAIQELGINLISQGAANTIGLTTTQQFGPITAKIQGKTSDFNLSDLLNIFLIRPDLNLGMTIKALERRNLLQILAEPNLLALSGKEASFLAGGELPIPVAQAGAGGAQAITILWKEFGVRLKFTADALGDGVIHLKVAPEVSSLDYTNSISLPGGGKPIPAIATRKGETEVELLNGQSFAIAGLLDSRLTELASKIPGLGDIPILGKLFRSRSFDRSKTELLVLVTPQLVKPLAAGQLPPMPPFPLPFIDKDRFDGKVGEAPAPKEPKRP